MPVRLRQDATHVYIPINKCANTSFKQLFKDHPHIIVPNLDTGTTPMTNLSILRTCDCYADLFKFTVVRHPISRFISAVNMFVRDGRLDASTAIKDTVHIMKTCESYTHWSPEPNLPSYIKRHTLPLTHTLYGIASGHAALAVDYVLKLEDREEHWPEFLALLGIPTTAVLPVTNATVSAVTTNHIEHDDLRFLLQYYEHDFTLFDYLKHPC
jgi:hypothetical protein